jgi:transcriptional regulator of acetoin/glycerol metabolism
MNTLLTRPPLSSPGPGHNASRSPSRPPAVLREARRRLDDSGQAPAELLGANLARSWQRSHQAGLPTHGRVTGAPHASAAQLARAMERQYELLSHARPVMDYMLPHVQATDSLIILADAQGMLLQALGDDRFADRAHRVALRPGAQWSEAVRGTNAIGTALADAAPVVIHGGEHYLERNGFLSCSAAPIIDPAGRLLGAIDISGDHRAYHPSSLAHTLGLACAAARMVEHRLFDTWHAAGLRLRFHAQAEGIGTLSEGLLAVADDGTLIGANSNALDALQIDRAAIGHSAIEPLLGVTVAQLLAWARQGSGAPHALQRPGGQRLWLRLDGGRRLLQVLQAVAAQPVAATNAAAPAPQGQDALAALDSGDSAVRNAIGRARRVLDKPIALLIQGESGTGKEVFARAVHASGPRRAGPFVAVNCAALPETLIESELFGYQGGAFTGARRDGAPGRVREAQGGTLFLDEIGDMPLAMQARLLRVLQDRAVVPLGGGKPVAVDCALVCATHRNLREAIAAGSFREDLYYRLNGLTLQLPPLRERTDLPHLLQQMLADALPERCAQLAPDLAQALAQHRWPGNLRQLANALRTACALLGDDEAEISWPHLPDDLADDLRQMLAQAGKARRHAEADVADAQANLRLQQDHTVRRVLDTCGGNLSEAARRLGISRNTLYRKLRGLDGGAPPSGA